MRGEYNLLKLRASRCQAFVVVALVLLPFAPSYASLATPDDNAEAGYWGPYCGLYCLYGAGLFMGHEMTFAPLLRREFVSSPQGSSLDDLNRAAISAGIRSVPVANLDVSDLRTLVPPAILHVRGDGSEYDHYVLYLGMRDGKARIYDVPFDLRSVEFSEVAATWDGSALLLGRSSVEYESVNAVGSRRNLITGAAAVAALGALILRLVQARHVRGIAVIPRAEAHRGALLGWQVFVVLAGSSALAGIYHVVLPYGLLANAHGVAAVRDRSASTFIAKVDFAGAQRLIQEGALLIDARDATTFAEGHIPDAMNIPVSIATSRISGLGAPSDTYVVYCESADCKYSDILARTLRQRGYGSVYIYRGGFDDWVANGGAIKP